MSTPANPYGIEPKLLGTRFGAALEAAAKDRLYRPQWEQHQRDEWMKAHPECVSSKPVYPLAKEQPPQVDEATAARWADVLSRMSETEYRLPQGPMKKVRDALMSHKFVDWWVASSGRFHYRRTPSGTKWLEAYYLDLSLDNQVSEDGG